MKDPTILIEREDIHRYMRNLFRTDAFKKSYDEGGFVYDVVDKFADMPRFFFEMSDKHDEMAHFSAWWGGIQTREYKNDAIHDLYYLHEIFHAGTMTYIRDMEPANFQQKMIDNELGASTCSEIQAYFEMPELRAQSFEHEIFADRFLKDPYYQARWQEDPQRLIEELKILRRDVMIRPDPDDRIEFWIHKFASQNDGWGSTWVHRYNQVETAMADLRDECRTLGRANAMNNFMTWLRSPQVTQGTDIPFPDEASAFAGIYWLNKNFYTKEFNAEVPTTVPQNQALPPPASGATPPPPMMN
jgi:hypothetical protein